MESKRYFAQRVWAFACRVLGSRRSATHPTLASCGRRRRIGTFLLLARPRLRRWFFAFQPRIRSYDKCGGVDSLSHRAFIIVRKPDFRAFLARQTERLDGPPVCAKWVSSIS